MLYRFLTRVPISAVLFLFFFSIYSLTMSGWFQYGGEIEKYRVAQSIVDRQSLAIRPIIAARGATGVGGQTYSIYEMGQTLLEVPFYLAGRIVDNRFPVADVNWITMPFVGLLNPILTALTCVLFFQTCLQFGFHRSTSLGLTFLFGLGTIAWPYSRGIDREPLMALLLLLSFYCSYRFAKTRANYWLVLTGLFVGYLAFTKLIQSAVIPVFLVYLLAIIYQAGKNEQLNRRDSALAMGRGIFYFVLPFFIFLALQSAYAFLRFGTFYSGLGGSKSNLVDVILNELRLSQPLVATAGLLFSPERSIFLLSLPATLIVFAWFKWFKQNRMEAALLLALLLVEFASAASRWEWFGGPRWGARYLVQITLFLIIPLGIVDTLPQRARRLWVSVAAVLFGGGFLVQGIAVLTNERDFVDITAQSLTVLGQLDFLRHGALDSVVLYLSPLGQMFQINLYGIVLGVITLLLGAWIVWQARRGMPDLPPSRRAGALVLIAGLVIEFAALIVWIVAPYPQVAAARADTRFVSANVFLADGRKCEATAMYAIALERGTTYQRDAVARLDTLLPRPRGTRIAAGDLLADEEISGTATIEVDRANTISGDGSLKASAAEGVDVIARGHADPLIVLPNTTYQVSGWIKVENIYGEGNGTVAVYEDDGAYQNIRGTDIVNASESDGWSRFQKTLTTQPTTHRLFVAAGLWKTFGTVWVDGLEVAQITADNLAVPELPMCN
jgi:Dolichyl-phosphate-mannose-protein mannosyltransferase